jgi:hypothetical protein
VASGSRAWGGAAERDFGVVTDDAGKAQQMILRFSTLLRRSLDEEAHEVPLQQELAFVDDSLEIQRGRLGDQLRPSEARALGLVPDQLMSQGLNDFHT